MVWECLIFLVYLPPFLRRHDFADKSEKTSLKSPKRNHFYFRFPCEANITLTLVRTPLIGSMNLGDQLKLALHPRTVVGVI